MRRVLHFMADIQVSSGMAAVVMNYYRHIDRSRVQFDFYILRMVRYPMNRRSAPWAAGLSVFPVRAPLSMGNIHAFFAHIKGNSRFSIVIPSGRPQFWDLLPGAMASKPSFCTATVRSLANPGQVFCATG